MWAPRIKLTLSTYLDTCITVTSLAVQMCVTLWGPVTNTGFDLFQSPSLGLRITTAFCHSDPVCHLSSKLIYHRPSDDSVLTYRGPWSITKQQKAHLLNPENRESHKSPRLSRNILCTKYTFIHSLSSRFDFE